jgi:thioredoxin-related protein
MNAAVLIVVFVSASCPPCETFKREIEARPITMEGVEVVVVDLKSRPELVKRLKIERTPTFVASRDGSEFARKVGYTDRPGLDRWIQSVQ